MLMRIFLCYDINEMKQDKVSWSALRRVPSATLVHTQTGHQYMCVEPMNERYIEFINIQHFHVIYGNTP